MSTPSTQPLTAGWYPDPAGGTGQRWHDGQGWTGQVSYATPRAPLGAPFARLADWLSRLLFVNCALSLLMLPLLLWTRAGSGGSPLLTTPATSPAIDPATGQLGLPPGTQPAVAPVDVPDQLVVALLFLACVGLVRCVTGVVWLVWQARVARSSPGQLRSSPAMQVVWWFVPFASYWMPVRNVSELWRRFGESHRRSGVATDEVLAPPVFLWWSCWIISSLLGAFTYLAVLGGSLLPQTPTMTLLGVCGVLTTAGAAAWGALVVRQLSWVALLAHADAP